MFPNRRFTSLGPSWPRVYGFSNQFELLGLRVSQVSRDMCPPHPAPTTAWYPCYLVAGSNFFGLKFVCNDTDVLAAMATCAGSYEATSSLRLISTAV